MTGRAYYSAAGAIALAASLAQFWIRMVGSDDNPVNLGFFGIVFAAAACAWTVRFEARGMARAMVAVAGVQLVVMAFVATAPSTPRNEPHGVAGVLIVGAVFAALWLTSAALFRRSARID
ncbi:hypothetical protein [Sphingomonas sp.]|uniref:hypothetical protein n=1 Tax=Sphingomonas sp. TaxID=28214 RepID=UPI002DD6552B|nr:hypothetical protein [Sphingomonas sp.]